MRHKQCNSEQINGTSLKGYITTTYDELCRTFGAPTIFVGDKTNAEWFIEFEDGSVATVYDWKLDHVPLEPYRWHIGGFDAFAVASVHNAVLESKVSNFIQETTGGFIMLLTNEEVVEILRRQARLQRFWGLVRR
jgi:hypothetical protein